MKQLVLSVKLYVNGFPLLSIFSTKNRLKILFKYKWQNHIVLKLSGFLNRFLSCDDTVSTIMVHQVAVIGAGAVGLSAALRVQQTVPGVKVTLLSEKFDEDTASWGAGGIFRLDLDHHPKKDHDRIR